MCFRRHQFICQGQVPSAVTHFTEELDFLSEADKDWIMGRAILDRLGGRETGNCADYLKYRRSGGAWFFFAGINRPSALR
jgi:hypothetical protein